MFGVYSETWTTRTAEEHQKSLSNEKFELWVMLSLCFSHVAIVASPSHSSVFHFLVKLFKIGDFHVKKKSMKLCLSHKNVNISSHRKGNLMALTAVYHVQLWLKVRHKPSKLSLPRQGPWNLVWVIRGRVNRVSLYVFSQQIIREEKSLNEWLLLNLEHLLLCTRKQL